MVVNMYCSVGGVDGALLENNSVWRSGAVSELVPQSGPLSSTGSRGPQSPPHQPWLRRYARRFENRYFA